MVHADQILRPGLQDSKRKKLFKIYLLQPVFVHIPTVDRRLQCMQFKYSLALTCAIIFLPWTARHIFPQLNLPPTRIERALPFEMFFGAKLLLQRLILNSNPNLKTGGKRQQFWIGGHAVVVLQFNPWESLFWTPGHLS